MGRGHIVATEGLSLQCARPCSGTVRDVQSTAGNVVLLAPVTTR